MVHFPVGLKVRILHSGVGPPACGILHLAGSLAMLIQGVDE